MNWFRKSLASFLVILLSASPSFSQNVRVQKERDEAPKSLFGNFTHPSTTVIVAGTAGVTFFTALLSYFVWTRAAGQQNNAAQNARLVIGAVAHAAFYDDAPNVGHEELFDQPETTSLETLFHTEASDLSLEDTSNEQEETELNAAAKPRKRVGKAIPRSKELIDSAQHFLGNHDYSAPRTARLKREKK